MPIYQNLSTVELHPPVPVLELPRFGGVFRAWVSNLCLMQLFISYTPFL